MRREQLWVGVGSGVCGLGREEHSQGGLRGLAGRACAHPRDVSMWALHSHTTPPFITTTTTTLSMHRWEEAFDDGEVRLRRPVVRLPGTDTILTRITDRAASSMVFKLR